MWGAAYDAVWDGAIRWQPEEVVWGEFVSLGEVDAMIARERFCPDGLEVFDRWRRWDGIRTAVPSDAGWVGEVVRAAFEPYVERIGREPAPMLEDFGEAIARSEAYVPDEGEAVIVLMPQDDHLLVRDVAVDPRSQGRGVGIRLMRFAELRAAELGLGEIRLFTNVAMVENHRFYAGLGYEETGRAEVDGYRRVFFVRCSIPRTASPSPRRRLAPGPGERERVISSVIVAGARTPIGRFRVGSRAGRPPTSAPSRSARPSRARTCPATGSTT